jgi:hypothetical protein
VDSASAVGDAFTILTSGGGVSGTFNGHPNGDIFPIGGARFRINYSANTVVLTHIADPTSHRKTRSPLVFHSAEYFDHTGSFGCYLWYFFLSAS